jgi:hypothetical protein
MLSYVDKVLEWRVCFPVSFMFNSQTHSARSLAIHQRRDPNLDASI